MTEIKKTLEKIKAASKQLEQAQQLNCFDEAKIQFLRDTLVEINQGMQQLKFDVNEADDSPIRCNK